MQLEFESAGHTYTLDGQLVPSVSEVLRPIVDYSMVPPDVLAAAAEFGANVHLATHLFDLGELDWSTLDPLLVPYVETWKKFLDESGAIVIASEQPIAHKKLGYAGTPDRVLMWRDQHVVPDLKSTAVVPRSVGPQTSAYAKAWQSTRGGREPGRCCVHLQPPKYRVHRRRESTDWSVFLSCLNIWKFNHAS